MSNLDRFSEVVGVKLSSYGTLAHFLNTTVEDCMCARGDWLATLLNRAKGLSDSELGAVVRSNT